MCGTNRSCVLFTVRVTGSILVGGVQETAETPMFHSLSFLFLLSSLSRKINKSIFLKNKSKQGRVSERREKWGFRE